MLAPENGGLDESNLIKTRASKPNAAHIQAGSLSGAIKVVIASGPDLLITCNSYG
jgi:hypothetical protein